MARFCYSVVVLSIWIGCAHYPVNAPLPADRVLSPQVEPTVEPTANTQSLYVCLAFSGGGTRAAALSYGVLKKLEATTITWKGEKKRLLDEVDEITSISGGSFTAAYYALFGERIFSDYPARFLYRNIQGELARRAFLNPLNWWRLASPNYSRIDIAAKLYHDTVFEGQTFGALHARANPLKTSINATNLANGKLFPFTQQQFDLLGSDLDTYPVARAAAASSAFPGLLTPVSLYNYPRADKVLSRGEVAVLQREYSENRRRYQAAETNAFYIDPAHPYIHLMDGGLADNIGLRIVEDSFVRGPISRMINNKEIDVLVIIVVNARPGQDDAMTRKESPPGLLTVANRTASISLDNYSFETIERMDALLEQMRQNRAVGGLSPVQAHLVEVNFASIKDTTRRAQFLQLPTSFHLSVEQVDNLIEVGGELLDQSKDFADVLRDVNGG